MGIPKNRFGHIDIPLQRVHIELTNVCEFNCVFCPKASMNRPVGYMDTALAKRLITELSENKVCEKVTFHVMGEPTLHKGFFDILAHAEKAGMKVGLTTNGAGLGGKAGEKLLAYNLHQLDISLQTPDERSFSLRGAKGMSFEEYAGGVMEFFRKYKAAWPDSAFKFRFLNTRFRKKKMEEEVGPVRVMSTTEELRETFTRWAGLVYDAVHASPEMRKSGLKGIGMLVSYKWNVVEVAPKVFFETYVLSNWGHAFGGAKVRDAWAGYCYGMRDHFGVLHNGDVVLCCIDYNGNTKVGNVRDSTLKEVLSSDAVGRVVNGFRRVKVVHPYCRKCLGRSSFASWLLRPAVDLMVLRLLKPFFYSKKKLYD